jgi:hypothetical protein
MNETELKRIWGILSSKFNMSTFTYDMFKQNMSNVEGRKKFWSKYSKDLKLRLLTIELNEELSIHVNDIEPIDPKLNPKPPIVTTILGALSFGVATKRYRSKKRQEYFRENVMATKNQYSFIDTLLKES